MLALYNLDASGFPTGTALANYNISIVQTPVGGVYNTWVLGGSANGWIIPAGTKRALVLEKGWPDSKIAFGYTGDQVDPTNYNCISWLGYPFKSDTGEAWIYDTSFAAKLAVRVVGQPF